MAGCCGNKSKNKWVFPAAAVAVLAVVVTIGAIQAIQGSNGTGSDSANVLQVIEEGESLVIPISEISETAKFYPVTADGTKMEVVAVTAPDGTTRAAFNTCQICYGSPYAYFVQQGSTLECQACGNRFPMNSVGIFAGGCNPVPIFDRDKTVTAESIIISYETLQAKSYMFSANWKTQ